MYIRQIILMGGIPFSVFLPKVPAALNAETMIDDQLYVALSDMEQIYSCIPFIPK